jgi:hypothetical protein
MINRIKITRQLGTGVQWAVVFNLKGLDYHLDLSGKFVAGKKNEIDEVTDTVLVIDDVVAIETTNKPIARKVPEGFVTIDKRDSHDQSSPGRRIERRSDSQ